MSIFTRGVERVLGRRALGFVRTPIWGVVVVLLAVSGARSEEVRKLAAKSTAEDRTAVSITIYNDDLGLVKEVRRLTAPTGTLDLKFEGVAARIDPTTVHIRSLDHPDALAVLEQNFEYDLVSPAKLMEKYVGRMVELVTLIDDEEVWTKARLVGTEGGYVYEIDSKIAVNPPGRVVLPELPEGLISRPTLVWLLENGRASHTVEASYLTGGIGWKCDYVLVLSKDEKKVDLSGWVTIDNRSGSSYAEAAVKLVAGDVNRVRTPRIAKSARVAEMAFDVAGEQFVEQEFFEYHLYTLQRPSTIKDNQTKQIGLLDATGASVKKSYLYTPAAPYWFTTMRGSDRVTPVTVHLSFANSKENRLGMPLPKGILRVYKRDPDDALQFIGEDLIEHTPRDEEIRVKMGNAFDVVGERVQTNFRVLDSGHLYESSYRVEIRNHKDEDIVVGVEETIPGDWEITESSHTPQKLAANRVRFDLPIKKRDKAELTYTVRVRQ